ncbi:hypothetical protein BDV95DRAFT_599060 [Massariosphaeria phaeospora]|uniref:Uncharacterized protein n=1 Tax=Massariosphaeria phaeospora TaxID=100035 RepID=A0A7C8HZN0_9PLEO|nr:hypothetical protein BDV95DRAFT_599060 [Massariosphaeria phaeospora]
MGTRRDRDEMPYMSTPETSDVEESPAPRVRERASSYRTGNVSAPGQGHSAARPALSQSSDLQFIDGHELRATAHRVQKDDETIAKRKEAEQANVSGVMQGFVKKLPNAHSYFDDGLPTHSSSTRGPTWGGKPGNGIPAYTNSTRGPSWGGRGGQSSSGLPTHSVSSRGAPTWGGKPKGGYPTPGKSGAAPTWGNQGRIRQRKLPPKGMFEDMEKTAVELLVTNYDQTSIVTAPSGSKLPQYRSVPDDKNFMDLTLDDDEDEKLGQKLGPATQRRNDPDTRLFVREKHPPPRDRQDSLHVRDPLERLARPQTKPTVQGKQDTRPNVHVPAKRAPAYDIGNTRKAPKLAVPTLQEREMSKVAAELGASMMEVDELVTPTQKKRKDATPESMQQNATEPNYSSPPVQSTAFLKPSPRRVRASPVKGYPLRTPDPRTWRPKPRPRQESVANRPDQTVAASAEQTKRRRSSSSPPRLNPEAKKAKTETTTEEHTLPVDPTANQTPKKEKITFNELLERRRRRVEVQDSRPEETIVVAAEKPTADPTPKKATLSFKEYLERKRNQAAGVQTSHPEGTTTVAAKIDDGKKAEDEALLIPRTDTPQMNSLQTSNEENRLRTNLAAAVAAGKRVSARVLDESSSHDAKSNDPKSHPAIQSPTPPLILPATELSQQSAQDGSITNRTDEEQPPTPTLEAQTMQLTQQSGQEKSPSNTVDVSPPTLMLEAVPQLIQKPAQEKSPSVRLPLEIRLGLYSFTNVFSLDLR